MGFRPNRSTVDNIVILIQMFKKSHEHSIDLYNILWIIHMLLSLFIEIR